MVEFYVDMQYLLEEGELDRVFLNDENAEHEPMEFVPKTTCTLVIDDYGVIRCSECRRGADKSDWRYWIFCPSCGSEVVEE